MKPTSKPSCKVTISQPKIEVGRVTVNIHVDGLFLFVILVALAALVLWWVSRTE